MSLKGVIVPLITPMLENGSLDKVSLFRLLDHVVNGGVSGVFLFGSCGEGAALSPKEKQQILRTVCQRIKGSVPVLAGIIEPSTEQAYQLGARFLDTGAAYLVTTPPFYYNHRQEEIYTHFLVLADKLNAPLVLYNITRFTKNTIAPETLHKIAAAAKNVIAIKDSDGDMERFQEYLFIRDHGHANLNVLQGAEKLAALSLIRGADGVVLGLANVVPHLCKRLYEAAKAREWETAWLLQEQLTEVGRLYNVSSWLPSLKAALNILGLCKPYCRLPFLPLNSDQEKEIRSILQRTGASVYQSNMPTMTHATNPVPTNKLSCKQ